MGIDYFRSDDPIADTGDLSCLQQIPYLLKKHHIFRFHCRDFFGFCVFRTDLARDVRCYVDDEEDGSRNNQEIDDRLDESPVHDGAFPEGIAQRREVHSS